MTDFEKQVLNKTKEIPAGKVSTYKEVAKALGCPRSFRAVANALAKNKDLVKTPCHRVVREDGFLGGYVLGKRKKIQLLKREGVEIDFSGRIDLNKFIKVW